MTALQHALAIQGTVGTVQSVQILMSAPTIHIIVTQTLPALTQMDPGLALVIQVIQVMEHHVPTSMSVLTTVTTVHSMLLVLITLVHGHALAMKDIQEMELYA
jgi:hypothetical protein